MLKVSMIGNLTVDPKISEREWVNKETGEILKAKVCNFTVAANYGFGNVRQTSFFKITVWRGLAEVCFNNLKKGRSVYIDGPVSMNTYTGTDNKQHSTMEVRAENIEFLGKAEEKLTPDSDMNY